MISRSMLALLGAVTPAALAGEPETTLDIVAAAVREEDSSAIDPGQSGGTHRPAGPTVPRGLSSAKAHAIA